MERVDARQGGGCARGGGISEWARTLDAGEGGGAAFVGDGRAGGDIGRNESGLDDHQQLLVRRQDEDLDDISVSISRIGQVGLTIGDELAAAVQDVGGFRGGRGRCQRETGGRGTEDARSSQKVGLRGQICVIIFLTIILFILFAIAFQ